jgi:hypothetical protein
MVKVLTVVVVDGKPEITGVWYVTPERANFSDDYDTYFWDDRFATDDNGEFVYGPNVYREKTTDELLADGFDGTAINIAKNLKNEAYFGQCLARLDGQPNPFYVAPPVAVEIVPEPAKKPARKKAAPKKTAKKKAA